MTDQDDNDARTDKALDAAGVLFVLVCFAAFVAMWRLFIEWAFGMFP